MTADGIPGITILYRIRTYSGRRRLDTEKERCRCCGREVEKRDRDFAALSDGSIICGECAGRVRILYPKSLTWVNVYYSGDTDYDYDSMRLNGLYADIILTVSQIPRLGTFTFTIVQTIKG